MVGHVAAWVVGAGLGLRDGAEQDLARPRGGLQVVRLAARCSRARSSGVRRMTRASLLAAMGSHAAGD